MAELEPNEQIAAVIIANWMGAIAAALIWLLEKEKSKYVAFQALQAVAYQFLVFWFGWLGSSSTYSPSLEGSAWWRF